jgi:hypothetical protein
MTPNLLRLATLAGLTVLAACKSDPAPSKPEFIDEELPEETGSADGGDGGTDGGGCSATVLSITPSEGTSDVFYRDNLSVLFSETVSGNDPVFTLTPDLDGATPVELSVTFDDTGMQATVDPVTSLEASTTYTLLVEACGTSQGASFTTSAYGTPLSISPADLIGRTYHFDLGAADYTQPEGLGSVLGTFLRDPLLIGVKNADDSVIEIIGTQGAIDEDTGEIRQRSGFDVWNFGVADFTDTPYFASDPTDIAINYGGVEIPMYQFRLEGSFSADGQSIGGAGASGIGDSRNMGPLIGLGADPDAVCNMAAGFGISCEECPTGGRYCLRIEAWFQPAPLVDGLTLEEP